MSGDPVADLQAEHRELGIEPGPWTATPDWHGERLDVDWALWVLRQEDRNGTAEPTGSAGPGEDD
jgi:hypothetical protein